MLGTFLAISASNWPTIWIGLEINLITFVTILAQDHRRQESYAAFSYFLFQEMGSYLLLLGSLMSLNHQPHTMTWTILTLALLLKIGAAPLHFWVPQAMSAASWFNCFFISSPQKIAPLLAMANLSSNPMFSPMILVALISIIWGALGAMSQTKIRQIMAFSSVNQSGWMLLMISTNLNLLMPYFVLYSLVSMATFMALNEIQKSKSHQTSSLGSKKNSSSMAPLSLSLISLSSLPPSLGFMLKWIAMLSLCNLTMTASMILIMWTSCLSTFAYMSLAYKTILSHFPKEKPIKLMVPSMIFPFALFLFLPVSYPLLP
uniref:NADH-ubiquinone oxidoreductase chain 2 n=1 Tax=Brachiopoda sp. TaxID=3230945 RepID=A0AAU8HN58_9BILA